MAKKTKRPARRAPQTKALARRKITPAVTKRAELLPALPDPQALANEVLGIHARVVPDDAIALGGFGVVKELKLTEKEERVLAEPVPESEIRIKPTAHATPYLSHPTYTKWLNRAFGRTGWQLVPVSTPKRTGSTVFQDYLLHIHGTPVAFAHGEQDYFDSNKDQSYGDALEATHASALRRCAKHLGIGLEMWDRDFLDRWTREHCVRVIVTDREGKEQKRWRRKIDPPFPFEKGIDHYADARTSRREERRERGDQAPPAYGSNRASGERITDKQRRRLWVIINNSGRDEEREVRPWLKRRFGIDSTKEITRADYETICEAIEASGDLPERAGERQPGED